MRHCRACEAYQNERVDISCPRHKKNQNACPDCGQSMTWNREYRVFECDHCEMYVEDDRDQSDFISSTIN